MNTAFFVISKIVWALMRLETLLALLLLASYWALRRERLGRGRGLLRLALIMIFVVGVLPVDDWALSPLERTYPANPPLRDVRGIIVLGGGVNGDVAAQWHQPALNDAGDRYIAAVALAQQFPAAKVFLVGGSARISGTGVKEATVAGPMMQSLGVAPDRIVLEKESRTTSENARHLRDLARDTGEGEWVLVTSAFHMRRAMESFCAAGWKGLIAFPTDFRTTDTDSMFEWSPAGHVSGLDLAMKEWLGRVVYRVAGKGKSCEPDDARAAAVRKRGSQEEREATDHLK